MSDPSRTDPGLNLLAESVSRLAEALERRALPLLERIAEALERAPVASPSAATSAGCEPGRPPVEFRVALKEGRWAEAEAISRAEPDGPDARAMAEELRSARESAVADLRSRIDAARSANDAEAVMTFRDDLAVLLDLDALREMDAALARWMAGLIQRRLRGGRVGADVATLAATVAERFGATAEGASLRASLPVLRRSAGLCPRCAGPYTGVDDACPKCLAAEAARSQSLVGTIEPADPVEEEPPAEPFDLNDDRHWKSA